MQVPSVHDFMTTAHDSNGSVAPVSIVSAELPAVAEHSDQPEASVEGSVQYSEDMHPAAASPAASGRGGSVVEEDQEAWATSRSPPGSQLAPSMSEDILVVQEGRSSGSASEASAGTEGVADEEEVQQHVPSMEGTDEVADVEVDYGEDYEYSADAEGVLEVGEAGAGASATGEVQSEPDEEMDVFVVQQRSLGSSAEDVEDEPGRQQQTRSLVGVSVEEVEVGGEGSETAEADIEYEEDYEALESKEEADVESVADAEVEYEDDLEAPDEVAAEESELLVVQEGRSSSGSSRELVQDATGLVRVGLWAWQGVLGCHVQLCTFRCLLAS